MSAMIIPTVLPPSPQVRFIPPSRTVSARIESRGASNGHSIGDKHLCRLKTNILPSVNLANARALVDLAERRQVVLVAALVAIRRRAIDVLLRAATAVRRAVAPVVIAGLLATGPMPVALLPSRCHSTTRVGWLQWVATHRDWYDIPSGPPIALPATVPAVATIDTTPLVEAAKRKEFERAASLSNAGPDTPRSRWEASGVAVQKEVQAIKEIESMVIHCPAAASPATPLCTQQPATPRFWAGRSPTPGLSNTISLKDSAATLSRARVEHPEYLIGASKRWQRV